MRCFWLFGFLFYFGCFVWLFVVVCCLLQAYFVDFGCLVQALVCLFTLAWILGRVRFSFYSFAFCCVFYLLVLGVVFVLLFVRILLLLLIYALYWRKRFVWLLSWNVRYLFSGCSLYCCCNVCFVLKLGWFGLILMLTRLVVFVLVLLSLLVYFVILVVLDKCCFAWLAWLRVVILLVGWFIMFDLQCDVVCI